MIDDFAPAPTLIRDSSCIDKHKKQNPGFQVTSFVDHKITHNGLLENLPSPASP